MTGTASPEVGWYCRKAPPDGGRDFGNPNVFAVPPDVDTLARETGQNSRDQSLGKTVHLRYSLIELTRDGTAFAEFLEALRFGELEAHLKSAADTKSKLGTRLRGGLKHLKTEPRLLLLRVDDFATTGMIGDERGDEQPFAALVRDNLNSVKKTTTAGGSYGLGKATLWRCSDLSTVLFGSTIRMDDGSLRTRFIGKTELTWHKLGTEDFAGPGWLGVRASGDSVWDCDALLHRLRLNREDIPEGVVADQATGTSALIVAFRDPQAEGDIDTSSLVQRIATAAAIHFWQAILSKSLSVSVDHWVDENRVERFSVDPTKYVPEFCDTYDRHRNDEIVEKLAELGDVVRVPVNIRVPATVPGAKGLIEHPDVEAPTLLLVRLAESGAAPTPDLRLNSVALLRGRGMVTRYWNRGGIVVGARPFHAVLLAGEAVGSDTAHRIVDQFLRMAEPPPHDDWHLTEDVRENYKHGAGARLKELFQHLTDALREVIKPAASGEEDPPEELNRLLQLEDPSPPPAPTLTLRKVEAQLIDAAWHVTAEVHANDRSHAWEAIPRLWLDVESGAPIPMRWKTLEKIDGPGKSTGETLVLPANARRLRFRAVSDTPDQPIDIRLCRARLDVTSRPVQSEQE